MAPYFGFIHFFLLLFYNLLFIKQPHLQPKVTTLSSFIPQSHSPSHRHSFDTLRKSSTSISTNINMPSIAVTPSSNVDDVNNESVEFVQKPTIKVGPVRSDMRRKSADPIEPIYSNM